MLGMREADYLWRVGVMQRKSGYCQSCHSESKTVRPYKGERLCLRCIRIREDAKLLRGWKGDMRPPEND